MELTAPPKVGEVIDDKYILERQLGQGGMGTVFAARHRLHGDVVAIKIMLDVGEATDEVRQRFMNEALLSVRIDSPHVARARDSGFWNGMPYIAMEFMEGEDLEQSIERRGPLPIAEAIDIVVEIADALAHAHKEGIIDRDIKPANIFLSKKADGKPCAKLLDFGISKAPPGVGNPSLTKTSSVMGSPLYMSPEQLKSSKGVDPTTDVWSLGIILFESVTGKPPFDGASFAQIFLAIVSGEIAPLRTKRPECPAQVEAAVAACLIRDRTQRTQTVAEFATAIAPWGTARSQPAADRLRAFLPPSSDPTLLVAPGQEPQPSSQDFVAPRGNDDGPHGADEPDGTLVMAPPSQRQAASPIAAPRPAAGAPAFTPDPRASAPQILANPRVSQPQIAVADPRASAPHFAQAAPLLQDPRASSPHFGIADPRASSPHFGIADPRASSPNFPAAAIGAPQPDPRASAGRIPIGNPQMPLSNPNMPVSNPMMPLAGSDPRMAPPGMMNPGASGAWTQAQPAKQQNTLLYVLLGIAGFIFVLGLLAVAFVMRRPSPPPHQHQRR